MPFQVWRPSPAFAKRCAPRSALYNIYICGFTTHVRQGPAPATAAHCAPFCVCVRLCRCTSLSLSLSLSLYPSLPCSVLALLVPVSVLAGCLDSCCENTSNLKKIQENDAIIFSFKSLLAQ